MRADSRSITISRFATAAIAADARHLALCLGNAEDKKITTALNTHRRAMLRLAATPAVNFTDVQRKGRALETAITKVRDGAAVLEGDFGLTGSILRDLRDLGRRD